MKFKYIIAIEFAKFKKNYVDHVKIYEKTHEIL